MREKDEHIHIRADREDKATVSALAERMQTEKSKIVRGAIAFAAAQVGLFELWFVLNEEAQDEQDR